MSLKEIEYLLKISEKFLGNPCNYEESKYVFFGVPYDLTSTYRIGSRYAPKAIREASNMIEVYSFRTFLNPLEIKYSDIGDLNIVYNLRKNLDNTKKIVDTIRKDEKIPILIGGEHTFTYSMIDYKNEDLALIVFDAHLDLRNEYLEEKWSHATFMRRIIENFPNIKIVYLGIRAIDIEELEYLKKLEIPYFTSYNIYENILEIKKFLKSFLKNIKKIHVSIDMDVLDPCYAPAVGNPEPDGITYMQLLDLLKNIINEKTISLDLTEVSPIWDNGQTSIQAAKILIEALCFMEKSKSNIRNHL
jgi:agmatinase